MIFTPEYRIIINKDVVSYFGFVDYLKWQYSHIVSTTIKERNLDLMSEYKFTVTYIPNQCDEGILEKLKLADAGLQTLTEQEEQVAGVIKALDPLNPRSVELSFKLGEIVKFVTNNTNHFHESLPGGVVNNYFGIDTDLWFENYPLMTGTVVKAVDYGTLDNYPLHLFDSTLDILRDYVLDLFAVYVKNNAENKFGLNTIKMENVVNEGE